MSMEKNETISHVKEECVAVGMMMEEENSERRSISRSAERCEDQYLRRCVAIRKERKDERRNTLPDATYL